jgi:hypothetical protein
VPRKLSSVPGVFLFEGDGFSCFLWGGGGGVSSVCLLVRVNVADKTELSFAVCQPHRPLCYPKTRKQSVKYGVRSGI